MYNNISHILFQILEIIYDGVDASLITNINTQEKVGMQIYITNTFTFNGVRIQIVYNCG